MKLVANAFLKLQKPKLDHRKQVQLMCPTPEPSICKKFEFFYGPYNFVANTKKFLTFDDYAIDNPTRTVDYEMN